MLLQANDKNWINIDHIITMRLNELSTDRGWEVRIYMDNNSQIGFLFKSKEEAMSMILNLQSTRNGK